MAILLPGEACRRKDKPTPLALVREDVPLIVWVPEPKKAIADVRTFLSVFEKENLGEQLRALRRDWEKQTGVDPLDAQTLEKVGLDLDKPWAIAWSDIGRKPVMLLAAKDPQQFVAHFSQTLKDTQLLDGKNRDKKVVVFEQPFGNTTLEEYALRVIGNTVLMTTGDGGARVLTGWPEAYDQAEGETRSFQKVWKRSESDGSAGGAALRILARDTQKLVPPSLREILGNAGPQNPRSKVITATEPEVRAALAFSEHKAEMFVALLGTAPDISEKLFSKPPTRPPGQGLPQNAVLAARSSLDAPLLYKIVHELRAFDPFVRILERELGVDALKRLTDLTTGAAALAVTLDEAHLPKTVGRTARERLDAVLDLFPMVATAELKDGAAFDRELVKLHQAMTAEHVPATLQGNVLKASVANSEGATLSRENDWLTYGVGPGAYTGLRTRLDGKQGIDDKHPRFGMLYREKTSGVIVDIHALAKGAANLPALLLGEQSALAKSFFGRAVKGFERFDTFGAAMTLEGPALGLHPVVRIWLTTK